MANRISRAAWKTSVTFSTFRPHTNRDHTYDLPEIRKIFQLHYGTMNQWPIQQMYKYLATGSIAHCLHAVQQCGCKIIHREWKRCFRRLCYTLIKTQLRSDICNTWYKQMITTGLSYTPWKLTMRPEETDCMWHNIYCTRSSKADLSPQYGTKFLRLRTIIVQLVTIKVIPHRYNGVYQVQ